MLRQLMRDEGVLRVQVIPSELVITSLLALTATNHPAPNVMLVHHKASAKGVRSVQVIPSVDVIARCPSPPEATATYIPLP